MTNYCKFTIHTHIREQFMSLSYIITVTDDAEEEVKADNKREQEEQEEVDSITNL